MKVINVILTGGVGSRLWPLSRKNKPKQYLDLFEGKSLFQQTVLRNKKFVDEILVVGNIDNTQLSKKSLNEIEINSYFEIIESTPRNTAAAIAFAAFSVNNEAILIVTPSDHLIDNDLEYEKSIKDALKLANENFVVTFGLKPSKPETGYGYIQTKGNNVISFREKPNLETAQQFLKDGNFFWNSGMFCFKASVYLEELQKYQPDVYEASIKAFKNKDNNCIPLEDSLKIPSISVDYAVMERTKKLQAVIGTFNWSDMGSFESIYEYLLKAGYPVDKNGNMVIGSEIHTEFLGFKKCILVITNDAILVLNKEKAQDVKNVYEKLENNTKYLL